MATISGTLVIAAAGAPTASARTTHSSGNVSSAAVHSAAKSERPAGSPYSRSNGDFCLYTDPDFTGTIYTFTSDTPTVPSGIVNNEAPIVGFGAMAVRLWLGPNYGNQHTCALGANGEGPDTFPNLLTPVHYY